MQPSVRLASRAQLRMQLFVTRLSVAGTCLLQHQRFFDGAVVMHGEIRGLRCILSRQGTMRLAGSRTFLLTRLPRPKGCLSSPHAPLSKTA